MTTIPNISDPSSNPRTLSVPLRWQNHIQQVLIPPERLRRRVRQIAALIEADYANRDLAIVSLLNGTVLFLADLIRRLPLPLRLDFIGVSSYRHSTESKELVFTKELRLDVRNRDVLVVDDILDTGKTLHCVLRKLAALGPATLRTCVLLDKPSRRLVDLQPDYAGFLIPDLFVVGYGLDYAERYRNLPFVGVLHPHIYSQPPIPASPLDSPARQA